MSELLYRYAGPAGGWLFALTVLFLLFAGFMSGRIVSYKVAMRTLEPYREWIASKDETIAVQKALIEVQALQLGALAGAAAMTPAAPS